MQRLVAIASSALFALASPCVVDFAGGRASAASPASPCASAGSLDVHEIAWGGVQRTYLVHAPASGAQELPLVLVFAGRGETPQHIAAYSGLSSLDAVVVYPAGLPGRGGKPSWSGTPTGAPGVDDIGFALAIADRYARLGCIDPSRVFATGKSDGGGLAAQLACAAADRFAAIAPVAGAFYPIADGCRPSRPVSVLEIHGTGDSVVPYDGSASRALPNVHAWLQGWAQRDGCTVPQSPLTSPTGVTRDRWSACRGGVSVEGIRIEGGGHTWPGATAASGPGVTSHAVDASAEIARFFRIESRANGAEAPERDAGTTSRARSPRRQREL